MTRDDTMLRRPREADASAPADGPSAEPGVVASVSPVGRSVASLRMRRVAFWSGRLSALFGLLRPVNCVLFIAGVLVGGVLVAEVGVVRAEAGGRLLLAALSAVFLGGAANAINDVFDLEIDRINRPGRPLPSGRATIGAAKGLWVGGTAGSLLLSVFLSPLHVAIAAFSAVALFAYSAYFKRIALAGNVLVALVVALALVYGGAAVGDPGPTFAGAAFAFLTTLAREVIKDIEDMAGDAAAGARTLPLVWSRSAAAGVAAAVVAATILLTPAPFLWLGYSTLYLPVVFVADALMLRVLWLLCDDRSDVAVRRAGKLMKWVMVAGMAALACAGAPE